MGMHDRRLLPPHTDTDDHLAAIAPLPELPTFANGTLYGLFAVGGMLGHRQRAAGWICRLVDALIAHDGFPQPLPLRLSDGRTSRAAHKDSRWPSVAVDAWLANQVPAALIDAAGASALAAASSRLDARARTMTVISGGRA